MPFFAVGSAVSVAFFAPPAVALVLPPEAPPEVELPESLPEVAGASDPPPLAVELLPPAGVVSLPPAGAESAPPS